MFIGFIHFALIADELRIVRTDLDRKRVDAEEKETLTENRNKDVYSFVPINIKPLVLALLRAALYSRCVAAS